MCGPDRKGATYLKNHVEKRYSLSSSSHGARRMVHHPVSRLMTKPGEAEERCGGRRSLYFFPAPQMMSPITTAATANTITRMQIFFRNPRWGTKVHKGVVCLMNKSINYDIRVLITRQRDSFLLAGEGTHRIRSPCDSDFTLSFTLSHISFNTTN